MSEQSAKPEPDDDRLELRRLLAELAAEEQEKPQGTVKQSEILDMIRNRKKRDPHG